MLHKKNLKIELNKLFYNCTGVIPDSPKDVKIDAENGLEVKENESFSLICRGQSYPSITSYRWLKMTNNQNVGNSMVHFIKSASLSDGGLYSCEAKNDIGTKKSQPVEIKIKRE